MVEDLEVKRKLQHYKEIINPNLESQNDLSILISSKKKINIAMIRTNIYQLHIERRHSTTPTTTWNERICHLCECMSVDDENHFLSKCPVPKYLLGH